MKAQTTVFGQILNLIPRGRFQRIVDRYKGDYKTHKMNCWTQFVTLLYAQLQNKQSLRDIETGWEVHVQKLYHLGMIKPARRSTLADANRTRNPQIYEDVFQMLLERCKSLGGKQFQFKRTLHIIDSTVISLSLSVYPWATWSRIKGAVRLHVGLNGDLGLPEFVVMTEGNVGEMTVARSFPARSDSIVVVDRGYISYKWLQHINESGAIFVTRAKSKMSYSITGQHDSDDPSILSDYAIRIPKIGSHHKQHINKPMRLITYRDPKSGKIFRFFTNSTVHSATQIADIYRRRWEIESFFRWIKQNLTIKTFVGTSKNAVITQLWIALCLFLLLWFIHHQIRWSKQQFLKLFRILANTALEHRSILELLRNKPPAPPPSQQTTLFNFSP